MTLTAMFLNKLKFYLSACFTAAAAMTAVAQNAYFQQDVAYRINVALDDHKHLLSGDVRFDYTNNAPEALSSIYIHLWGNAYKNRETAFCRQKLQGGNANFYFAPDSSLGYFTGLDFLVDGQKVAWAYDEKNPDIGIIYLPQPLQTGEKITVSTPFTLKIPATFSRLGHVGTSYQITQWFPKPAVYDSHGWHAFPYLDQGEFYSEFGSFDVKITLPENYVVGATGELQTASELAFLNQKERETRALLAQWAKEEKPKKNKRSHPFPASATEMKTLHYTADHVHDFAWFADKRFYVLKDTALLPSGRSVDCWAMFTDEQRHLWTRGAFYVKRAVEFLSETVGEYPWPHATAVHSALSAGGGMEYPMITVIGDSGDGRGLDEVITHEVGHNWFYGILASNEREHGWLDEGINSYYEQRYMRAWYGGGDPIQIQLPKSLYNPAEHGSLLELGYLFLAREHKDLPPDTHSDVFSEIAYGLQVYMKPALCLRWLEESIGRARFDAAMQHYFQTWKFRHPYPDDLRASWAATGLDADWFFDAMQTKKQADLALVSVQKNEGNSYTLELKNKGELAAPYSISALKNGKKIATQWYAPVSGKKTVVALEVPELPDAFQIDADHNTLDVNRTNNTRRLTHRFPFRIAALNLVQNPEKTRIGIFPWIGWNNYDKTMLGLLFYNAPFPPNRFQYYIAPGIGLGSKRPAGTADLKYKFYPDGFISRVTLGLNAKSYDFNYNWRDDYYTRFYRIQPKIKADLRSPGKSFQHALQYRALFIGTEAGIYDQVEIEPIFSGKTEFKNNTIHELRYEARGVKLPNPYDAAATLEYQGYKDPFGAAQSYLRGSVEWQQRIFYKPRRKITARFYAGYFIHNTKRNSTSYVSEIARGSLSLNPQGFNDYKYDQVFLGRSATSGILSRQVSQTEGGFKAAFGAPNAGNIGNSNQYILALNLKADLPAKLPLGIPIKPYFDIGLYDATGLRPKPDRLLWSGGLMLEFFKGGFEVYFPLVNSKALKDQFCLYAGGTDSGKPFCGSNYWQWISWSVRINTADPLEMAERLVR